MSSERWKQIEQLYHSTLEKDVKQRDAFLDQACVGDEDLRREVESLLSYEGPARDFIESPALELAARIVAQGQDGSVLMGQMINQYRVSSRLGTGGMGEVFLADDTRLGRKVAIKFLPAVFTEDKKHLERFAQEARAVAALSHPNVCTIHEVIETAEGRHCIVMEYVDGETLREPMSKGQMKVEEALEIAIQGASALAAAHAAGVVHRDIKPENIMLRRDSYVKVLDFGLAKLTATEPAFDSEAVTRMGNTSPGIVMGTFAYMSPEQARGLSVDVRTDVWSLGVVLYEMISGQKPFAGETPTDVIISIAEREPPPLSGSTPEAPAQLEQIVTRALAKDRKQRYQTANDLLKDLKSLKHHLQFGAELERVKPTRSVKATDKPSPITPARILILTAIAAVLIGAALLAARFIRRSPPPSEVKSLAVLPLQNVSGDPSQDYFADGMTDALITNLSKISGVRVIPRPAVMSYKNTSKSPAEIGRELKLDGVITGSVARNGDRVRLVLEMIHVPSGRSLWTERYDRDLRNVLTLQTDVRRAVAEKTGLALPSTPPQTGATAINAQAFDEYLRGRFYLYRQTKEDNESAIAALEKAVATDPNFAAAHAELAQAYVWKLFLFTPNEKQLAEKAFIEVEKALALDPDAAVAYLARGRLLWTPANHFPHTRAIKEYRHALALDPTLYEARNQLALVFSHIGALPEALEESQLALTADPNNHLAQFRVAETLNFQGKYEEALNALHAIPTEANPALIGHQTVLALFNLGRTEEAAATVEKFLRDYPDDNRGLFSSLQAMLAASAGHEQLAEQKIALAIEKGKGFGHFHHTAYQIACVYALMKKPEQAIKWLQAAADDGFPCYPLFAADPNLNNIRQDSKFVEFLSHSKQKWEDYKTVLQG